jgi:hypothetical protein
LLAVSFIIHQGRMLRGERELLLRSIPWVAVPCTVGEGDFSSERCHLTQTKAANYQLERSPHQIRVGSFDWLF